MRQLVMLTRQECAAPCHPHHASEVAATSCKQAMHLLTPSVRRWLVTIAGQHAVYIAGHVLCITRGTSAPRSGGLSSDRMLRSITATERDAGTSCTQQRAASLPRFYVIKCNRCSTCWPQYRRNSSFGRCHGSRTTFAAPLYAFIYTAHLTDSCACRGAGTAQPGPSRQHNAGLDILRRTRRRQQPASGWPRSRSKRKRSRLPV